MKTFRMIGCAIFAILLCLSACSGGGDDPIEPTPKPEVTKSEITIDSNIINNGLSFSNAKGEQSISFSTNEDWTLSVASTTSGATWCTASVTNGSKGNASVKFSVTENTDYDDRSVSVTIKSGTASKTFTISQKSADALLVTTNKYEVSQEGGTIDIEVKANIEYKMEISETAKDWISDSSGRGLISYKHSLNIAMNEEKEKREGEIYFKSGEKADTVKVYQMGGPIILLSQNENSVSDAGDTISVDVKSNIEYGVQMPDVDWIIDESSSRGMSSHTLKYIISANEEYDGRSANIIFYDKNSDLKDTLKVVQTQKNAILISKKNISVPQEGDIVEVKVNTNVDIEIQIPSDIDWITKTDSRALTEKNIYLKITENMSEKPRHAKIIIINKECQLSDTLFINQKGVYSDVKLTYTTNIEELEGWTEGLFCTDGTYYMAKPSEDNACMVTIGNFITEENCIIYIDENKHVREVFSVDKIFTFNNYTDHSVDISFLDENNVCITETVERSFSPLSRSSDDHGQLVNGINLGTNMWSIKEAANDIAQHETTYKYGRGWQSYLLNVFNGLGTALEIGGGPEYGLFDNSITDWIGHIDNGISIGEMGVALRESLKIKNPLLKPGPGGPAVWAATAWLGFIATYFELYDEHIQAYYGNTIVEIETIKYENNGLNFELKVSGYENIYNLECGVLVKQSDSPIAPFAGRFPSDIKTIKVTENGTYSFFVDEKKENEQYWCYPFLIEKSRTPLWIGFIGEKSGPLVRYGKAVKLTPEKKISRLSMYEGDERVDLYEFYYRNDSIIRIEQYEDGGITYTFNYVDDETINVVAQADGEYEAFYLKLNEDGYIKSCSQSYHGEVYWSNNWNFEYNEAGQLVYVSSSRYSESWRITYNDSNAVGVSGSDSRSISYGNLEGKGYWVLYDWMYGIELDDEMEVFGLLGLLGKPSKNLPSSGCSWSVDADGYPDSVYIDGISMNFSWE